ncbi:MAG: tripartite tricarboxylate transporter permease [Desulfobacterales bacterium]|nr:tripartite tricarboxylate transporter permease [Desulfobacterales bacterium]
MLEAMWEGFRLLLDWQIVWLIVLATAIGNFFGAVPGLGGNLALALLIPFVFGMQPFAGLAFLLAMHSVVQTGGAIPSILFGIPGTGPCTATIIDGLPMTKKGEGGVAMGAQLAASGVGGVIGGFVLALLIPVLRPIIMAFGSPEIFMLIVFGLTMIVVVSRESIAKGFIATLIGLMLGMVGLSPHTGIGRFTFDQLWLWDGIHVVCIVLGIFAYAEMMELGARGHTAKMSQVDIKMSWQQLWKGTTIVFKEWWLTLRTSIIGVIIGIIPGLGGDAASWICYAHAAQTCKNNENFGKGDIRGVIAVETANNSKEGGALLPTLGFGIPGSSGMAILLGAFLILGITPGPKMLVDHLDIVWGMVWVLIIANIFGAVSLYPLTRYMGMLAFLRSSLLIPPIMFLAAMGAFLIRGFWQDVVLAVMFGFFGYAMKRFNYPRATLVLGFIMGPLAEDYFYKSMSAWGFSFLLRPVTVALLILAVLSLVYSVWKVVRDRSKKKPDTTKIGSDMLFSLFLLMVFIGACYMASTWPRKTYPLLVIIPAIMFSVWHILLQVYRLRTSIPAETGLPSEKTVSAPVEITKESIEEITKERIEETIELRNERIIFLWLLGFLTIIMIAGFWVAMLVFIPLFMFKFGHEKRKLVVVYTACFWVSIYVVFQALMKSSLFGGVFDISW